MSGISAPLKNGSLEPPGSSQTAVNEWYLNTSKEWFFEASGSSQTAVHEWYLSTSKERFFGAIRKLTGGCP